MTHQAKTPAPDQTPLVKIHLELTKTEIEARVLEPQTDVQPQKQVTFALPLRINGVDIVCKDVTVFLPAREKDYTAVPEHLLRDYLGSDAREWARAFGQMAVKLGYSEMDEGWLIGWFANAIEGAAKARRERRAA